VGKAQSSEAHEWQAYMSVRLLLDEILKDQHAGLFTKPIVLKPSTIISMFAWQKQWKHSSSAECPILFQWCAQHLLQTVGMED
jgi:hypothetical protein